MITKEIMTTIIKNFNSCDQLVFGEYIENKNISIIFDSNIMQSILNLFGRHLDDNEKNEIKHAVTTILKWYSFYKSKFNNNYKKHNNKQFKKIFPTVSTAIAELEDIENIATQLLTKLDKSSLVTKYILKKSVPSSSPVIDHHWFEHIKKVDKPGSRTWAGKFVLIYRRTIRLYSQRVIKQYFYKTNEISWPLSQLFIIFSNKRHRIEQNSVLSVVDKNLIEQIAYLSFWANNRREQLKLDQIKLAERKNTGERSMVDFLWPFPGIFLMKECGLLLSINDYKINNFQKLAILIHKQWSKLYSGKERDIAQRLGESDAAKVKQWLKKIKPYLGKCIIEDRYGRKKSYIFPPSKYFPTLSTPTLSHCLRFHTHGGRIIPPGILWVGPGWEKAGTGLDRHVNKYVARWLNLGHRLKYRKLMRTRWDDWSGGSWSHRWATRLLRTSDPLSKSPRRACIPSVWCKNVDAVDS